MEWQDLTYERALVLSPGDIVRLKKETRSKKKEYPGAVIGIEEKPGEKRVLVRIRQFPCIITPRRRERVRFTVRNKPETIEVYHTKLQILI